MYGHSHSLLTLLTLPCLHSLLTLLTLPCLEWMVMTKKKKHLDFR